MSFGPITSDPKVRRLVGLAVAQARNGDLMGIAAAESGHETSLWTDRKTAWTALAGRGYRNAVFIAFGLDGVAGALWGRGLPAGVQAAIDGSGVISARVRDGQPCKDGKKRRVTRRFWDLKRHYTDAGWAELAKLLDWELYPMEEPASWTRSGYVAQETRQDALRAIGDRAELVLAAASKLQDWYNAQGTSLRVTAASSSMELWRRRFLPPARLNYWIQPHPHVLDFMRGALYAGRNEVIRTGVQYDQEHWDIRSHYPAIAARVELPCVSAPWTFIQEGTRCCRGWEELPSIVEATVRVPDMALPPLPFRSYKARTTIYPTGTFRGRWHGAELRYAQSVGVEVLEIHRGIVFKQAEPYLAEYMRRFFHQKETGPSRIERKLAKIMLVSLVGKFAQGNRIREVISADELPAWEARQRQLEDKAREAGERYTIPALIGWPIGARDPALYLAEPIEAGPPGHANVFWTGEVCARARTEIHRAATCDASGVTYLETDAIIARELRVQAGLELGAWTLKNRIPQLEILALKTYRGVDAEGIGVACAGGIPEEYSDMYLAQGHALIERRAGWCESVASRRGIEPGEVVRESKRIRAIIRGRHVLQHGETAPLHVEGGMDVCLLNERRAA